MNANAEHTSAQGAVAAPGSGGRAGAQPVSTAAQQPVSTAQPAGEALRSLYRCIDALIEFAYEHLLLEPQDHDWALNSILEILGLEGYEPSSNSAGDGNAAGDANAVSAAVSVSLPAAARTTAPPLSSAGSIDVLLREFTESLQRSELPCRASMPSVIDRVMAVLSARPSLVQTEFADRLAAYGARDAMQWLYDFGVNSTYVKKSVLERNPRYESCGLIITINSAKPEFKNMKTAAAGNSVGSGYPQCTICHENEGFAPRDKRTLRTVPLQLGRERWFWQFSPYGYFDQHGICVNAKHTPMHVDVHTFEQLLDFVGVFPHYFIGCNAALPRIGGSVLAHDHYQGGGERMPMHGAVSLATLVCDDQLLDRLTQESSSLTRATVAGVSVELLDWPGTAVRVVSSDRTALVAVCEVIREGWARYNNPELGIACVDAEGAQQSSLSPSVVLTSRGYEMSLILRNNAVSEQFPEGVFHAHPQWFAIKQEPIGLIEAQGLFILPGRLIDQLAEVEQCLVERRELPEHLRDFAVVADPLRSSFSADSMGDVAAKAHRLVQERVAQICREILKDTAVFKDDQQTVQFLTELGFVGV